MRKVLYMLMLCTLLIGCDRIKRIYDEREVKDSLEYIDYEWVDDSPIDTVIIDRIYNATTMEEVFPE